MSVTGPSYNINAIAKLSELELEHGIVGDGSWHDTYKDSCYVFVGGLPFGLNEGDLCVVFSQWGEIVDVHLVRDKKTGASKGYGFIGFENQKSTVLAVDNFNGYELLGRKLRVDHCRNFRAPSKRGPNDESEQPYEPSGAEGQGLGTYGVTKSARAVLDSIAEASSRRKHSVATHEERLIRDADEEVNCGES